MMVALALSPTPIQTIISGIQETAGIGRTSSNNGLIKRSNKRYHPIKSPSGTPIITAKEKPRRDIFRLAMMLVERSAPSGPILPSLNINASYTSNGDGVYLPTRRSREAKASQITRNTTNVATVIKEYFRFCFPISITPFQCRFYFPSKDCSPSLINRYS